MIQARMKKEEGFQSLIDLKFFFDCFNDPPITLRNPDLNFRIPIHKSGRRVPSRESGDGKPLNGALCTAIVVS